METRHPIEIYFGREFPAICYHCGVLTAWSRQNWNIFEKFLRFAFYFGNTTPLCENFKNSVRKVYITTPIDVVVCKIRENCPTGNRWNRALFMWPKKNKISAPSQTVAKPKVCHGQPQQPTFGSQRSKFHLNLFTFGGVIAGRVNAVKTRLKVFPILCEAIASRRVIN